MLLWVIVDLLTVLKALPLRQVPQQRQVLQFYLNQIQYTGAQWKRLHTNILYAILFP